jgi:hypothetical protein
MQGNRVNGDGLDSPIATECGLKYHHGQQLQFWFCGETSMLRHQSGLAVKESELITTIERELPDFAKACRSTDNDVVAMHQDAFAADYQDDEYKLLGMAIKFAGICGKEVHIIGANRSTVDQLHATH